MSKTSGYTRNPYNTSTARLVTTTGKVVSTGRAATIIRNAESIGNMEHRDMQKEINQAISRFTAELDLPERNIKLANLDGAYGATFVGPDGSGGIYLDKKTFDVPKAQFEAAYKKSNYARRGGFKNVTRKPAQHTVTHELAHALWASAYRTEESLAARKEIRALYRDWRKDTSTVRKKNYGSYGASSVDEFWAEVITKGVHGDNDRYTRRAQAIAKKYLIKK